MMKKAVFLTMILALSASVANAGVHGLWIRDTVGGNYRYTLEVTSDEGVLTGFDMSFDSSVPMLTGGAPTFSTATDADTHFLFQKSHVAPPLVTDLAVAVEYEDAQFLLGAFTATAGGVYAAGWSGPVNVLQIVTGEALYPEDVTWTATSGSGLPMARIGSGGTAYLAPMEIDAIPEPSTFVLLLALGLAGLVAWRRR